MDSERIDRWCEHGIFGLTLFILIFSPLALGAVRSFEFVYVQGATIAIALLWLVRAWTKPAFEIFWPPLCWPVLAFLLYALIRYLTADVEYVARLEFIRICVYAVLFFAVLNNLHQQKYIQIISWALVLLATAISLYALFQFATNSPNVWHFLKPSQYVHRGSGTFINPNHLAGFLEVILPIGLGMLMLGRVSHVGKIILGYTCSIVLVGIGVSLSRGGWIATSLSLICFFITLLLHTRNRWLILAVVLAGFIGTAFYLGNSLQFQNRFQKTFSGGKVEDSRFDYWKPTIQMWKDHFWTGVGPAHFDVRFPQYRPREVQARPQYSHNDYLNALADWGLIGMAIIASFCILFYSAVFQASMYLRRKGERSEGKSNRGAFVFGSAFGVLALLLHSVTDFNMQIPGNAMLIIVIVALTATQLRYSDRFWIENKWIARFVVSLLSIAAAGVLGFYGVRKVRENFWLSRVRTAKTLEDKISASKQAAAIEPHNASTMTDLAETLRVASFHGDSGYEKQAEEAMTWYRRAMALDPFTPYNPLGLGMCLDWLGRTKEAAPYFTKALELDPNSYYVVSYQGWHQVQLGDYPAAEKWFDKSLGIWWNEFALDYIGIVREKMAEAAAKAKKP